MAEIYVNLNWTDEAAFNADTEKPSGLIWGSTAFNSLSAAVKAADASADTTITVAAGTYTENLDITVSEVGEQKGKLSFVAAEDGVIIAGTVQVGYYERGVGNEDWKSKVAFTGITFDHAESAKHSLNIGAAVGGHRPA